MTKQLTTKQEEHIEWLFERKIITNNEINTKVQSVQVLGDNRTGRFISVVLITKGMKTYPPTVEGFELNNIEILKPCEDIREKEHKIKLHYTNHSMVGLI